VNIKFCLEAMEESGSEGLDELLEARKNTDFIKKVRLLSKGVRFSLLLRRRLKGIHASSTRRTIIAWR
jgi:hypothetical protein